MYIERINVLLSLCACVLAVCWAQQPQNPCPPDRFGKSCECVVRHGDALQERGCRPNDTRWSSSPLCSGRGDCVCGVCQCVKMEDPNQIISGPFCECDNFTCDRTRGQICSGPEHGECVCGMCVCRPGYTGDACECSTDDTPCRSPYNDQICNGNGRCVCGQCVCDIDDRDEQHFVGRFCDKCPTCPGKCEELKECVLCYVHHRGAEWSELGQCTKSCALPYLKAVPIIIDGQLEVDDLKNEHLCSFRYGDHDDCSYVFAYSFDGGHNVLIRAQKKQECSKRVINNSTINSTAPNNKTQEQI